MSEGHGFERPRERGPVARFEDMDAELWNIKDLPEEERAAALDAIEAYKHSENKEYLAGAVAVSEHGHKAVMHNENSPVGRGQEGHAEMLALAALYATRPSARSLKILALAGSFPSEDLTTRTDVYGEEVHSSRDVHFGRICGRCLKRASDYSGNDVPLTDGTLTDGKANLVEVKSPVVLMVVNPKQVVRTTLRVLYPLPHVNEKSKLDPWVRDKDKTYPMDSSGK